MVVQTQALRIARRPRDFVRVAGPDAEDFLQRMLSQDVAIDPGDAREALLLTPKARVIATMVVLRRGADDYLLSTDANAAERVLAELRRYRFAARVELELEHHDAAVVFSTDAPAGVSYPVTDYGEAAWEVLDADVSADGEPLGEDELELLRIRAKTAKLGREIDERVLPAEAGLTDRAVSFTKGCYPGQEPVARLHYRGHANRSLRLLALEGNEVPAFDQPLALDGKEVGRITSAVRAADGVLALGFVRREVPDDAELLAGSRKARQLD